MKIVRIEREVCNKVFIGGYETVEPKVRVVGELEPGDDLAAASAAIEQEAQTQWVQALQQDVETAIKRRTASGAVWSDDRTTELVTHGIPAIK